MAEGGYKQVHLREAEKPFCDICKQKVDIQLKKCLDCDLYLCDKCALCHKEIPLTKNHSIISRVERQSKKILETSRMCSLHPNDEVMFYCSTCKTLICSDCVIGIHKKHKCIKIKSFAKEKRQELKTQLNKTEDIEIPAIKSKIAELNEKSKNNDLKKKKDFEKLKARKLKMQKELEKINKKLEAEYESIYQKKEDGIGTTKTKLNQDLSEIETMWSDFTKILHTGSDLEAIQAQKELSEKLESVNFSDTDIESHLPTFIEGKTDDKILKAMYGCLDTGEDFIPVTTYTDVEVIHHFNPRSTGVNAICPLTDNNALIHYFDLHDNDIVTVNGEVQQTLNFNFVVADFILTSGRHIMSTPFNNDPTIYRLTQEGVVTDIINTAPLQPGCLCQSMDGNLLVSLVDERSHDINQSSRRCVSRITMKGKVLQSYEYNKGSRLFTSPASVSENINRDVCVVNRTSDDTGHLIILDHTGKLKFRYNGQQLDKEFDAEDVKCDKSGNIIVADSYNQTVHLLDIEGKFLRYIVIENNMSDHPLSLAIDNKTGILWVGTDEGDIYTIRYQN